MSNLVVIELNGYETHNEPKDKLMKHTTNQDGDSMLSNMVSNKVSHLIFFFKPHPTERERETNHFLRRIKK